MYLQLIDLCSKNMYVSSLKGLKAIPTSEEEMQEILVRVTH